MLSEKSDQKMVKHNIELLRLRTTAIAAIKEVKPQSGYGDKWMVTDGKRFAHKVIAIDYQMSLLSE